MAYPWVDPGVLLKAKFKLPFYNTSRWTIASLIGDREGVADNLVDYIAHFSPNVRDVFDGYWLRQSLRRADPCIACAEELSAVATGGSRWPLILMW